MRIGTAFGLDFWDQMEFFFRLAICLRDTQSRIVILVDQIMSIISIQTTENCAWSVVSLFIHIIYISSYSLTSTTNSQ